MESKISLVITRMPIKKTINAPITFTAQKNIENNSDSCTTRKKNLRSVATVKTINPATQEPEHLC